MNKDVIPDSHANRLVFLKVLLAQIIANAAVLNLDAAFVANVKTNVLDPLIAAYQKLVDAEAAATAASADAAQLFEMKNPALRGLFNNLKANTNFTDGMAEQMGIATISTAKPAAQIKPRIKVEAQPGHVRLTGSKDYAQAYNVYMRVVGTTAWILVGSNRMKFPFDDQTPLKTPGVAEAREYYARGVNSDVEVGVPSDIVTATFAG